MSEFAQGQWSELKDGGNKPSPPTKTKIPQVGGAGLSRTNAHAQMCRHVTGEVPFYSPQLRVVNFDAIPLLFGGIVT